MATPYALRQAYAVGSNVEEFCRKFGIEKCGFLTLTFKEFIKNHKEAQRRFHSFMAGIGSNYFGAWAVVLEKSPRDRLHYHLLVECQEDIRTGFNFEEVRQGKYGSANEYLRGLWAALRGSLPGYGFGRHELLPIRTTDEAIAHYVGKYLSKDFDLGMLKGARRVRYSQGWKNCSMQFGWNTDQARAWRKFCAAQAAKCGCRSMEEVREKFGPKWAFRWMGLFESQQKVDQARFQGHKEVGNV